MRSFNVHEKRFFVASILSLVVVACSSSSDSGDGAGSPDAGASDSGVVNGDAGSTTSDAGDDSGSSNAITGLVNDTWTWVDFPDSVCANGSPTGIAINPHAGATNLMIYFEGGGDCVDATTCWGPAPGATNLNGFTAATFAAKDPKIPTLTRTTPNNPFADMSMVYIPYCTGDMHAGTVLANLPAGDGGTIPTYFYGARDMDIFLKRIVPTFPSMSRIWELGTSAGGYGTFLNFPRVSAAFGVGVDIIDDSGPPIVPRTSTTNTNSGLFDVWGINADLPAACASYNSLRQVLDYDLTAQQSFSPPGKFGFMSFLEDSTIGPDFGYDDITQYPAVLQTFTSSLPVNDNVATYLVGNYPSHVVESDPSLVPDYFPWMTDMIARNASWVDETHDGGN